MIRDLEYIPTWLGNATDPDMPDIGTLSILYPVFLDPDNGGRPGI